MFDHAANGAEEVSPENGLGQTRRALLEQAGVGLLAAGGALAVAREASAAGTASTAEVPAVIASTIVTAEHFGVTFLTQAVRQAPGTPSEMFVNVLKAANTAEFDHIPALRAMGGRPLTTRFWIPDAAFGGGGAGLFATIEMVENIEISAYLTAVTAFSQVRRARDARVLAAAMGTEAEHRVLARSARATIAKLPGVPNDKSFESYTIRTAAGAQRALEALGIGFGREGRAPGKFYDFPGSPLRNGTGSPLISRFPA